DLSQNLLEQVLEYISGQSIPACCCLCRPQQYLGKASARRPRLDRFFDEVLLQDLGRNFEQATDDLQFFAAAWAQLGTLAIVDGVEVDVAKRQHGGGDCFDAPHRLGAEAKH